MLCKIRHYVDSSFAPLVLVVSLTALVAADFQKFPIVCFGAILQPVSRYTPFTLRTPSWVNGTRLATGWLIRQVFSAYKQTLTNHIARNDNFFHCSYVKMHVLKRRTIKLYIKRR